MGAVPSGCCKQEEKAPEELAVAPRKAANPFSGPVLLHVDPTVQAHFVVDILRDSPEDSLGLSLMQAWHFPYLHVLSVQDGLVADWNESHPNTRLLPDDKIVKVNRVSGNSYLLLEELQNTVPPCRLRLTVERWTETHQEIVELVGTMGTESTREWQEGDSLHGSAS
mmetsp:Transcript_20182/g.44762  ORF Transcript_20182/g.44762 Transcript_20182/m.44762 type:complete len:167 (+) Transcript_20182:65-565(+)|eukprot:CAMPEP_0204375328 /NCGR_PEP_ID=MMETSP0469-20131031/49147_1 /ASSEMBLY_ACC=CAM_ASM_000384 /TAXON_ID=2969 /ORGANISM="Oxyrrhis marina" /LENGTH=166 /DNA_ID=CAMNT_0051365995 /DNA_START=20 /DNA_END=520 /DNA_ORIENTATION=+